MYLVPYKLYASTRSIQPSPLCPLAHPSFPTTLFTRSSPPPFLHSFSWDTLGSNFMAISRLNLIFFPPISSSSAAAESESSLSLREKSFLELNETLDTNHVFVAQHTSLMAITLQWDQQGRKEGMLIKGQCLEIMREFLEKAEHILHPEPTLLMLNFFAGSAVCSAVCGSYMGAVWSDTDSIPQRPPPSFEGMLFTLYFLLYTLYTPVRFAVLPYLHCCTPRYLYMYKHTSNHPITSHIRPTYTLNTPLHHSLGEKKPRSGPKDDDHGRTHRGGRHGRGRWGRWRWRGVHGRRTVEANTTGKENGNAHIFKFYVNWILTSSRASAHPM